MATRLTGKEVVARMGENMRDRVEALAAQGITPTLAIVRVGERPDDLSYERTALKRAEGLGIEVRSMVLPVDASQDELLSIIENINADDGIHGCLLFRPLPKSIDEKAVCDALAPRKDIDGISAASLSAVFTGEGEGFAPATAQACIEMLDFYGIGLEGKHVCVVGRSLVIGRPVAMMALERNASVTICHSKTSNLAEKMRGADIVICATGRARAYGADCFNAGQTVLDVGINFDEEGNLCGDVDFTSAESAVEFITPVPGGLGSVTTSVTMMHVIEAAEASAAR